MDSIVSTLINEDMLKLIGGMICLMVLVGRFIPFRGSPLNKSKHWGKVSPVALAVLCIGGSWLPGITDIPADEWGGRLMFAFIAAVAAVVGKKWVLPGIIRMFKGKSND